MNDKIYDLVIAILNSRLSPQTMEEIVKFYLLPRNTPVRPMIELPDENIELGMVRRPTAQQERAKMNPKQAEAEEEVRKVIKT